MERGKKQWRVRKAVGSGKDSGECEKQWRVERVEEGKVCRGLESRGLVDFLIRDVGVDFLGEVVVFTVHL